MDSLHAELEKSLNIHRQLGAQLAVGAVKTVLVKHLEKYYEDLVNTFLRHEMDKLMRSQLARLRKRVYEYGMAAPNAQDMRPSNDIVVTRLRNLLACLAEAVDKAQGTMSLAVGNVQPRANEEQVLANLGQADLKLASCAGLPGVGGDGRLLPAAVGRSCPCMWMFLHLTQPDSSCSWFAGL